MLFRWLSEHRSCPCCRSPITSDDIRPIHRIWREKLIRLRMKCQNAVYGCTAEVTLEELPDHLMVCEYAHVSCPHASCPEVVMRTTLRSHLMLCQYRRVLCDDCGLEFLATEKATHKCIVSLREHMREQVEIAKKEMIGECMKHMRRERRHYENLLQEQKKTVDDLRRALNNLMSHQRMTNKLSNTELGHSSSCSRGISTNPVASDSHQGSDGRKLSLPRLAPLHTHMNLSRPGGNHLKCFYGIQHFVYTDRSRSRSQSGDNNPR